MDRVLLLIEHSGNRRLLAELLSRYELEVFGDSSQPLRESFDLCVLDSVALTKHWEEIVAWKKRAHPEFLPVLLLTPRHDVGVATRRLWEGVDELIVSPIEKGELRARVEILLRARRLSRENAALRRQLEAELERAARVQAALLPETVPAVAGFELAALCLPAREVGGDFYDWQESGPGTLTLTLGDVCGKGMPAALLMATIRATLRAVAHQNTPAASLELLEHALTADLERSASFVTLFHAQLDVSTRRLRYVDAGHGYSFVRRSDGRVEALPARRMPLGISIDGEYPEGVIDLADGDALIVHSDGLIDARRDQSLTPERLADAIDGASNAREVCDRLLELAAPPAKLPDDLTMIVLRCVGRE